MDRLRNITKNLLIAFMLISIGFALGKEVTARRQSDAAAKATKTQNPEPRTPNPEPGTQNPEPGTQNPELQVIVYYLHTTFRCVTCNEIERLAKTLVETEFAEELAAGRIAWREANFQLDEALAKRYNVVASCVVVAHVEDGRETDFQRLDDVWTRYKTPSDFNQYIGAAIETYLKEDT